MPDPHTRALWRRVTPTEEEADDRVWAVAATETGRWWRVLARESLQLITDVAGHPSRRA